MGPDTDPTCLDGIPLNTSMAGATHSTTDKTVRSPRMSLVGSDAASLTHWGRTLASTELGDKSLAYGSKVETSPRSSRSSILSLSVCLLSPPTNAAVASSAVPMVIPVPSPGP